MKLWASLVAQMVKNLPAMSETQVQSKGLEDPLEKGMATLSSILAKDILCDFLSLFHELFALSKYLFELFINIKYSISNACAPACPVCLTLCDPMACSP